MNDHDNITSPACHARPVISLALWHWIEKAARDLSDDALDRISHELANHLADGVEQRMALGDSPAEAERQAVNQLGDPARARKLLNRVSIMKREVAWLQRRTREQRWSRWGLFLLLPSFCIYGFYSSTWPFGSLFIGLLVVLSGLDEPAFTGLWRAGTNSKAEPWRVCQSAARMQFAGVTLSALGSIDFLSRCYETSFADPTALSSFVIALVATLVLFWSASNTSRLASKLCRTDSATAIHLILEGA